MMKFLFKVVVAAVIAFAIPACSSHKKNVVENTPSASKRVKAKSIGEVASLAETYKDWSSFYAPFTFRCSQPLGLSLSGRASMVKDEFIYLSMRMIGFEVASLYIDRDSAFLADKYHKIMVAAPLESITARTGLTVSDLQDILLGRAFYPGQGTLCSIEIPETLFSPMDLDDGLIALMPRRIPSGVAWQFVIDAEPSLRRLSVEPEGLSTFLVDYSEISETPAGAAASLVMITGEIGNHSIEAMTQWNLSKATWNQPVAPPSLSFKGYRRISPEQMIESIRF